MYITILSRRLARDPYLGSTVTKQSQAMNAGLPYNINRTSSLRSLLRMA